MKRTLFERGEYFFIKYFFGRDVLVDYQNAVVFFGYYKSVERLANDLSDVQTRTFRGQGVVRPADRPASLL